MPETPFGDLRNALAARQREHAELELQVDAFESEVRSVLDPLQERLLRVQMERLKEAAQSHMRSARLRNAYHEAQDAYERFTERSEAVRERALSESEMQAAYRQASKQCHPDAVPEPYREAAAGTFRALETAYGGDHRSAVAAIADALDAWGFPDRVEPGAPRGERRKQIQEAVASLEASIDSLRSSEAYQAVRAAPDVEAAVEARKRELARTLREMEQRGGRR